MIAVWADVKGLMIEPRDALEAILARRALAVSAILGIAGYYGRTLLLSELLFAPLGGAPAYLVGNCLIALGWTALVVAIVCAGARLTSQHNARWTELFALWGYTQVPAIILTVLTGAALLLIPAAWRRDLDFSWLAPGIAVTLLLVLWGLLLKLHALRVWSGRSGWPLFRMVVAALALYSVLAWGEHIVVAERGVVPVDALRAMAPTVTPFVVRRDAVALLFDKLTYRVRPPYRGEIVAYVPLGRDGGSWSSITRARVRFVGRIIGVPGDTVEIRQGRVFLNGRPSDEPYRAGGGPWSLPATTVRAEHYFVLGDNREVVPGEYEGGLVGSSRLRGRLTEVGRARWEFVVGKGRW